MNVAKPILELVAITKQFGSFVALKGVDIEIAPGSVTCIVGPSGSGKSTLLRTINGLEEIDGGAVFFKGEMIGQTVRGQHRVPVSSKQARLQKLNFGMVFQTFNLFPNRTVMENVTLAPITVRGHSRKSARAAALQLLERVGLEHKKDRYPNELSGGQQQRVAIARALAMEPEILLFDEPTSALDPELVGEVLAVIKSLAEQGSTMLIVTHEMAFAQDVADEVVMMADGEVIERGSPKQVVHNSSHQRAREFFSSVVAS
ncbi:amino acid ABC transporter ATP-binding protein [Arthrobacter castelli]|uniref:amino acid ABC transporter ATP-binding protein n=1 Tax=Arthrobacter castelli TaxID=271431 RepID=UPI00056C2B63|nr:amino acid ABC transporter ATP-binding protein [Arthrobacter castelli]